MAVLLGLLDVEADVARWREVLEMVADRIDALVRVGQFSFAAALAGAVASAAARDEPGGRQLYAGTALEGLATEELVRRAIDHLSEFGTTEEEAVGRLLHALGPCVIAPIVHRWSAEKDGDVRKALQDIVLGFGARGRESVQELMNADDWEVRRTAVVLLREFGGNRGFSALAPLLNDGDARVRREAFCTLALEGNEEAFAAIERALAGTNTLTQTTLREELPTLRDARARPFLCYLVGRPDHFRAPREEALAVIDILGDSGDLDAVGPLRMLLGRSVWWPPGRSRALHRRAAEALRRIGKPEAIETLQQLARSGARSARAASRAALASSSAR
jgi:HEAT repeat protein